MSWYSSAPKKSLDSDRLSISSLREPDVSQLHHQIEELLLALSQMQKETIELKDDLMQTRLDKMDVEAERDALKITMENAFHSTKYEQECLELRRENAMLKQEREDLANQQIMSKDALSTLVERMLDIKNKADQLEQDNKKVVKENQRLEKEKRRLQKFFNSPEYVSLTSNGSRRSSTVITATSSKK